MRKLAVRLVFTLVMVHHAAPAVAALVVEAEQADIRTEGGPNPGGG